MRIEALFNRISQVLPVPLAIYQSFYRPDRFALSYHMVSDQYLPYLRPLFAYKNEKMFRNDLEYIGKHFSVVSVDESQTLSHRPSRPPLLITFDDGYREWMDHVRPLLLRFGFPALFFITSSLIDNKNMFYRNKIALCLDRLQPFKPAQKRALLIKIRETTSVDIDRNMSVIRWLLGLQQHDEAVIDQVCRLLKIDVSAYLQERKPYLTSDDIRRLTDDGFEIGAHSVNHPRLGLLPEVDIEYEIVASCETIQRVTGKVKVPFAFPHSGDRLSRDLIRQIRQQHPCVGILFDSKDLRQDDDFIINRIWSDQPAFYSQRTSNLPALMRNAYNKQLVYFLQKKFF